MLRRIVFCGLVVAVLTSGVVQAQRLTAELVITKVTIMGPGLAHPLVVRDAPAAQMLFSGGPPVDWSGGTPAMPRPTGLGRRYDITQYSGRVVDWVRYYLGRKGQPSYFFYRSAPDGWLQPEYNRQWFRASPELDRAIRHLLITHRVPTA